MNYQSPTPSVLRERTVLHERAAHAQQMMELRPDGGGFRRIHEHSNQVSLVERYLIAAGDMSPLPRVPDDRSYRRKRREPDERQKRRAAVAKKEAEPLKPTRRRGQSLEPSDQLVEQVLGAYKAKSPAELVLKIVSRMGYASIYAYYRAASRVERFMCNLWAGARIPNHIRDKFVLKRLVERCLEKRFGSKAK